MLNLQQLYELGKSYDIDIFSGMTVPDTCEVLDAAILKSVCFEHCGLNIPIYPDPETFAAAVSLWSKKNQYTFEHIDEIMKAKYSPIENVFEDKTTSRKFDGKTDTTDNSTGKSDANGKKKNTEKLTNDKTDLVHGKVTTDGGSDTNTTEDSISAYDQPVGYQPDKKSVNTLQYGHTSSDSGTDSTTRNYTKTNELETEDHSENKHDRSGKEIKDDTEKITENRHGNIGITSANKLQIEEYNMLAEFNPYTFLAKLFESELTLFIY